MQPRAVDIDHLPLRRVGALDQHDARLGDQRQNQH